MFRPASLTAVVMAWLWVVACSQANKCRETLPLAPMTTVPVGQFPIDVVAGDVNGDGAPDLVSADARAPGLSVRLGRGDGTFTAAPGGPLAVTAHLLALADVDRDGDLDLLSSYHDSAGVEVRLGDGKGGFTAVPGSPFTGHSGKPHNHGLAVGDVSGDGLPDVVTANQEDLSVSVLLGDGSGRFAPAAGSPIRLPAQPYFCALADLDGDGKRDIVVPLVSGAAVAVLRGDGQGGFTAAPGSPYATIDRPYAVAVADINADSRPDVLVAHDDTDKMSILVGQANGRLAHGEGSPLSLGSRLFVLTTADLNGDGAPEVIGGAGDRLLVLVQGPGRSLTQACRTHLQPLRQAWSALAADLNRDGRPDIVAPDAVANALQVWLSTGR